jgi:WXG100 family type VII secretion target
LSGHAQVTPEMLTVAGNKATHAGEHIAVQLSRLLNEIESHHCAFKGHAGTAFQTASTDLGRELRALLSALNTMAENVHASSRHYGTTDADAGREISSIVSEQAPGAGNVASLLRGKVT